MDYYTKADVDAAVKASNSLFAALPVESIDPTPPPGPVEVNPSIEYTSLMVGVRMRRKPGLVANPYKPAAGWWYTAATREVNESDRLIGTAAECVASTVQPAEFVRYRERYDDGLGNSVFAWSDPIGPFVAAPPGPTPVPPPVPAPGSILQRILASMTEPNEAGSYMVAPPLNGDQTADRHGMTIAGQKTYAYIGNAIRRSDANSFWPGKYLDSSFGLNASSRLRRLGWYVIGRRASMPPNQAINTRTWMGNWRTVLLLRNGQYRAGVRSPMSDARIAASWHASFSSPGNERFESVRSGPGLYESRSEDGGVSCGGITAGDRLHWALHGYPVGESLSLAEWVNDVVGVIQLMDGELRLQDANGPDDRDRSGLDVWFGADWYNDGGQGYLGEHGHGRLQSLTKARKTFAWTDIPIAMLIANPPPESLLA